jgi:Protein of unknown function (DUF2690)
MNSTATAARRLLAAAGAAMLLTGGSVIAAAPSAQAAWVAPCTGTGCQNKDPHTVGCDKDPAVRTVTFVHPSDPSQILVDVQFRFSPGCHAAWARVFGYAGSASTSGACNGGPGFQGGRIRTQFNLNGSWVGYTSHSRSTYNGSCPPGDVTVWSKMVPTGSLFRTQVCRIYNPTTFSEDDGCTPFIQP